MRTAPIESPVGNVPISRDAKGTRFPLKRREPRGLGAWLIPVGATMGLSMGDYTLKFCAGSRLRAARLSSTFGLVDPAFYNRAKANRLLEIRAKNTGRSFRIFPSGRKGHPGYAIISNFSKVEQ